MKDRGSGGGGGGGGGWVVFRGFQKPKLCKEGMKLNWNFWRVEGVQTKQPLSIGPCERSDKWICSETAL